MGQGESAGLIWWLGSPQDLTYRLLAAGSPTGVEALGGLSTPISSGTTAAPQEQLALLRELIAGRPGNCVGLVLPPGLAALRAAVGADGLAKAVGWADSLAFAGGLPGAFAFLARVGGMVAAIREAVGERYCEVPARIEMQGPEAWAALAALTQLRACGVSAFPDAMTGAVAHRLGVEMARYKDVSLGESAPEADRDGRVRGLRFDSTGFFLDLAEDAGEPDSKGKAPINESSGCGTTVGAPGSLHVGNDLVELHTVAAQLRLFTSREPSMRTMRQALVDAE